MPVLVPVVAAAAGAYAGVGVLAAATTLGGMIAGGMMIAGAALTAVGTVTGNEKLTKYGGLLGMAGGAGAIMSGAYASAANQVGNQAAVQGGQQAATDAAAQAGTSGAGAATAQPAAAAATGTTGASTGGVIESNLAAPAAEQAGQAAQAAGPAAGDTAAATLRQADPARFAGTTGAGGATAEASPLAEMLKSTNTASPVEAAVRAPASQGNWLTDVGKSMTEGVGSVSKWMNANPELTKTGMGLIQGGANAWGQQEALKSRYEMEREDEARRRQEYSDSVTGVSVPLSIRAARRAGPGLINRVRGVV